MQKFILKNTEKLKRIQKSDFSCSITVSESFKSGFRFLNIKTFCEKKVED